MLPKHHLTPQPPTPSPQATGSPQTFMADGQLRYLLKILFLGAARASSYPARSDPRLSLFRGHNLTEQDSRAGLGGRGREPEGSPSLGHSQPQTPASLNSDRGQS